MAPTSRRRRLKTGRIATLGMLAAVLIVLTAAYFLHLLPPASLLAHLTDKEPAFIPVSLPEETSSLLSIPLHRPLVADFSSAPEQDYSPRTIRFLDLSRGEPETWNWDFGDGSISTLQHPVHEYGAFGRYNVTLTTTRSDGAKRIVQQTDILGIDQPAGQQVQVDTLREGVLSQGSGVSFLSSDANSSLSIGGKEIGLPAGSVVKLRTSSPGAATITIRDGRLTSFGSPDAMLYINGTQVADGVSGTCILPACEYFRTNLTYAISPVKGEMRQILVNGSRIRAGAENSRVLISHQSDDHAADMTLITSPAYFEGLATGFELSPAVIADFDPESVVRGPAPLTVTFRDTSAGFPGNWSWNFGDGSSSVEQNPSHVYQIPGTYGVTLTVRKTTSRILFSAGR